MWLLIFSAAPDKHFTASQTVDGPSDRRLHSIIRGFDYDSGSSRYPQNQPGSGQAVHKFRPACLGNARPAQKSTIKAIPCQASFPGAKILPLASRQMPSALGQASCLPVAAASSRELMLGRLIVAGTSGRMPAEPAPKAFGGSLPYIPCDMNASIAYRSAL